MKRYLLGIDVGTTGTKSLLFSESGELLGQAYCPYDTKTPQVHYNEQDAQDWWRAVCKTVREACGQHAPHVAAVSLSVQGGTVVAVDENGMPISPAIVWNDARGVREKEAYLQEVGDASTMYQKSGWNLIPGQPAVAIRWMKDNQPETFQNAAHFLTVPDYISRKMTGVAAVDLSNLGINQLGDIRRGCYDEQILGFAGITEEKLAGLCRSGDVIGHLTPQAAEELGLSTDVVLVAGAHDQYAVALGAGATRAGDILVGTGTAWVVTAMEDKPAFETGLAQSVAAVPGMWGSLLSLPSGGVCLEWWRKLTERPDGTKIGYDEINREVAARKAAEDGLFFFPFAGKSSASRNFQKGTFVGLDLSHDKFHLARAIMEGVAFQAVWMMESFRSKPSAEGLKLAGGAARSEFWCQLMADIAGVPVRIPEVVDLACVGAAILAGAGSGIYEDVREGYRRLAVKERVITPDPERSKLYRQLLDRYKICAQGLQNTYDA